MVKIEHCYQSMKEDVEVKFGTFSKLARFHFVAK
jgi:hypothetical protein